LFICISRPDNFEFKQHRMQTIFLINDNIPDAANAAAFAWHLAQTTSSKIVLGSFLMAVNKHAVTFPPALITSMGLPERGESPEAGILAHLKELNSQAGGLPCRIEELNMSGMEAGKVARFINENNTLLIIKSATDCRRDTEKRSPLKLNAVLSKVNVPVCLVPAAWQPHPLQSVAYLTDLRYCRTDVVSHLLKCLTPEAAIYIAHMAISGLADLASAYAHTLFERFAGTFINGAKLYLHHIRDSQSLTVADVLANSMNNDALVLTHRSSSCQELVGADLSFRHPDIIRVPLLIYPA
jgi:hypothetical protein